MDSLKFIVILQLALICIICLSCRDKILVNHKPSVQDNYYTEVLIERASDLSPKQQKVNADSIKFEFTNQFALDTCVVKLIDTSFSVYKTFTISSFTGADTVIKGSRNILIFIEYLINNKRVFVYDWYYERSYSYFYASLNTDSSLHVRSFSGHHKDSSSNSKCLKVTLSNVSLAFRE